MSVKENIWVWQQLLNKVMNFTKWMTKKFVKGDSLYKALEKVYGNEEITLDEFLEACFEYIGDSEFISTVKKYTDKFLSTDEDIEKALKIEGLGNTAKKLIKESYKWNPNNIDKEDVKIYYDLLDKLILVNPTDATYDLPVRWYSFLYDFCEAFEKTLKSEKKDLQKWYRETTPSSISKDDYFECDTDTIDSIYFAMEDYLNGELTESKKSARKSLKESRKSRRL